MKKAFITTILSLIAVLPILAQNDIVTKIDEMVNKYHEMNLFSGTVMVAENGKPIYRKAVGYAAIENKIPNEMNTAFNFGSIGKIFTSVAILKLTEEGKLFLDDNIGKYLDYFPKKVSEKVTIRHLLRHEGGLGDYLNNPQFRQNVNNYKSLDDLMNLIKEEPLLFEPGTNNQYSNSGYATLGAVVASVTKKSFYTAIEDLILRPLGLGNTYYSNVNQVRDKVVKYFRNIEGNIVRTPFQDWPSPAGGEYSTVEDLMNFAQGVIYSDKILSDKSKVLFLNRFEKEAQISIQQIMQDEKRVPFWAGGAPGLNAAVIQYLEKNITITVLSNFGPPTAENVGRQIKSIIDNGNYQPPQIPLQEKIYKTYLEKGSNYIEKNFNELITGYPIIGTKDQIINQIGYNLMAFRKLEDAIQLFEVNTKLFPKVANTFDSLAEAYMNSGNKEKAVGNYKKALELNPNNLNALQNLKKLQEEN